MVRVVSILIFLGIPVCVDPFGPTEYRIHITQHSFDQITLICFLERSLESSCPKYHLRIAAPAPCIPAYCFPQQAVPSFTLPLWPGPFFEIQLEKSQSGVGLRQERDMSITARTSKLQCLRSRRSIVARSLSASRTDLERSLLKGRSWCAAPFHAGELDRLWAVHCLLSKTIDS